jgi:hypothetical protein
MSATNSDPRSRASQRLRDAKTAWGQAMTAHTMAPPDAGFAGRLRALASAAETEREGCEEAAEAGLMWRPIPGAQGSQPPYELRPGPGRRGPAERWERFDAAVENLNHAITGTNVTVVAREFAELASATGALAEAVEAEDKELAAEQPQRRSPPSSIANTIAPGARESRVCCPIGPDAGCSTWSVTAARSCKPGVWSLVAGMSTMR